MLLAQITDLHLRREGALAYGKVDTRAYAAAAFDALARRDPRPDLLLVTGDIADAGEPEAYAWFAGKLAALGVPAYVIPGNHDLRQPMRDAFGAAGYLPDQGFLQYVIDAGPVRVIALDTLIENEVAGEICAERLAWLADRLAEDRVTPTIVMMHHQPFPTATGFDAIGCAGGDDLAAVIAAAPNVERLLCGHMHQTILRRWAGTVASVCPGTAHQIATELADPARVRITAGPAGYQLHHWSEAAGLVTHTVPIEDPAVLVDRRAE